MRHPFSYLSISILLISVDQCLAADADTNAWGAVTNHIQMSISLKDGSQTLKTNQPVELTVRYRNVSTNETVLFYDPRSVVADVTYSFQIISPSGTDISPVRPTSSTAGSTFYHPIAPGGSFEADINLSSFCKFDQVGAYKVVVKKVIFPQNVGDWFTVVSNELDVDIMN